MFITHLWNYFYGYAIITVKGIKTEQFINLAVINGIYLWDIEKLDYMTIRARINVKDFFRLRQIVKKTGTKVRIQNKCGMPFRIKTIKKRKLLVFGLGALLLFLYILSLFIWMIEIDGHKTLANNVILEKLDYYGLKVGILKKQIDKRHIENEILIAMPELAWVGIEIKGTKAYVTVSEKIEEPEYINIDEPCDIIAIKNAVIEKIFVLNGDGVVNDGDTVEKGQILVSGIIERENVDIRYTHAMAKVLAKAWYEDVEEIYLKQIEFKSSGCVKRTYGIELLGKKFHKNKAIPFKDFNKSINEKYIFEFGDYIFPIKYITIIYSELIPVEKSLTLQEAKERCRERLNAKIRLRYPENAVTMNKKLDYFFNKESVIGKMYVETIEDIAEKKQIDILY